MIKKLLMTMTAILLLVTVVSADVSIAGHSAAGGAYAGSRGLGLGIVLGVVNGLSVKNWTSGSTAFQFDATWDLNYGGVGFGAAYLIHDFSIIRADDNKFPLYFGIKGWAALASHGLAAGIQVPLGIAWIPRDAPIDVFLQIEPGISVVPAVRFTGGGGLGIRFWFN